MEFRSGISYNFKVRKLRKKKQTNNLLKSERNVLKHNPHFLSFDIDLST